MNPCQSPVLHVPSLRYEFVGILKILGKTTGHLILCDTVSLVKSEQLPIDTLKESNNYLHN